MNKRLKLTIVDTFKIKLQDDGNDIIFETSEIENEYITSSKMGNIYINKWSPIYKLNNKVLSQLLSIAITYNYICNYDMFSNKDVESVQFFMVEFCKKHGLKNSNNYEKNI